MYIENHKSRRGIYYNLEHSTYFYNYGGYTFYFSSDLVCQKFQERLPDYVRDFEEQLSIKWGLEVHLGGLPAIIYYQKMEKRGFRVLKGGEPLCLNSLTFVGGIKIESESRTLYERLMQNGQG